MSTLGGYRIHWKFYYGIFQVILGLTMQFLTSSSTGRFAFLLVIVLGVSYILGNPPRKVYRG